MAKAKLTTLTKSWINNKTSKSKNIKILNNQKVKILKSKNIKTSSKQSLSSGKRMQTIYISNEAAKRLWQNRVETGRTLSSTIDALVLTHLKKK